MNNKKYIAPQIELLTLSTKTDCMLNASGETEEASISIGFDELL